MKVSPFDFDDPAQPVFPTDFKVVRKDVLQCTDLKTNHNKYYCLELHEASDGRQRVYTQYGRTDELDRKPGKREHRYPVNDHGAGTIYETLLKEKTGRRKDPYTPVALASSRIGTSTASAGRIDAATVARAAAAPAPKPAASILPDPLRGLVARLYREATGKLTTTVQVTITAKGLETPLGVLTLGQIEQGERILKEIAEHVADAVCPCPRSFLDRMSSAFYSAIPHKLGARHQREALAAAVIDNGAKIQEKQQTLELMRDMLGVDAAGGGAGLLASDDLDAKYRALGAEVTPVTEPEFGELVQTILAQQLRNRVRRIAAVYRVRRAAEAAHTSRMTGIGNIRPGYHASKAARFVGILSRGLLLPKIAVQSGVTRTDGGWLGAGIYFGREPCTAAFYASPTQEHTKWMVVADVACGKVFETTKRNFKLTAPPAGYDSCLGLARGSAQASEFDDNEQVVYDSQQAALRYLVEFTGG